MLLELPQPSDATIRAVVESVLLGVAALVKHRFESPPAVAADAGSPDPGESSDPHFELNFSGHIDIADTAAT